MIGVDAGTTVTKAVAFDADGVALARAARPTVLDRVADGQLRAGCRRGLRLGGGGAARAARTAARPGDRGRRHRTGRRPVAARRRRPPGPAGDLLAGRPGDPDPGPVDRRWDRGARLPADRQLPVPGRRRTAAGLAGRARAAPPRPGRHRRLLQGHGGAAADRPAGDRPVRRLGAVPRSTHPAIRHRADRRLRARTPPGPARAGARRAARAAEPGRRGRHRTAGRAAGRRRALRPAGVRLGRRGPHAGRRAAHGRHHAGLPGPAGHGGHRR